MPIESCTPSAGASSSDDERISLKIWNKYNVPQSVAPAVVPPSRGVGGLLAGTNLASQFTAIGYTVKGQFDAAVKIWRKNHKKPNGFVFGFYNENSTLDPVLVHEEGMNDAMRARDYRGNASSVKAKAKNVKKKHSLTCSEDFVVFTSFDE